MKDEEKAGERRGDDKVSPMKPKVGSLLVVDDDKVGRTLLTRSLEERGYTVMGAENGELALELIEKHDFDLVLLDITMPGIDGVETLGIIRKTRSRTELPVIMVTAKGKSEDIVEALDLGANDYVTKPPDFAVLSARVDTHLSLKRAEEIRREAEQLRVLVQTAGAAAHEINQHLAVIVWRAELLLSKMAPANPQRTQIEAIRKAGQKIRRIVLKMQDIRRFATKPYVGGIDIVDFISASQEETGQMAAGSETQKAGTGRLNY